MRKLGKDDVFLAYLFLIPVWWLIFFTASNQVYGIDAWYYLSTSVGKPIYFNLFMVAMWFSFPFLFSMVRGKKQDYLLISSLFLMNLFSMSFLEVKPTAYVMYLFGFIAMIYFREHPLRIRDRTLVNHYVVAVVLILFWFWQHNFASAFLGETGGNYLEGQRSPIAITYFLVGTFYLLLVNKYWKQLAVLIALCGIFMSYFFIGAIIPVFVFAIFLDFLTDEKFHFHFIIMLMLMLVTTAIMLFIPFYEVNANLTAFQKYCNTETRICNNSSPDSWYFGHYFAWRGYISNDTQEFGVCYCSGDRCLVPKIQCGRVG